MIAGYFSSVKVMKGKEKLRNYCRQREAQEKWILLHAVRGSKSDPGTEKKDIGKNW